MNGRILATISVIPTVEVLAPFLFDFRTMKRSTDAILSLDAETSLD